MDSVRCCGPLTVGPKLVAGLGTQSAPADVDYKTTMNFESLYSGPIWNQGACEHMLAGRRPLSNYALLEETSQAGSMCCAPEPAVKQVL